MKILLADDDKLIRFSLKSMITEIPDIQFLIAEASNGLEMVQRCREFDPDVAFVDIRMPYLNGIDAIAECRNLSPQTEFIVITGYSDFEYAKKCIPLGVREYILKPISFDQLHQIILHSAENMSQQLTQKNNQFQLFVYDFFLTPGHTSILQPSVNFHEIMGSCYTAFMIQIDCARSTEIYNQIYNQLLYQIKSYGNDLLRQQVNYSIIYSQEGSLQVIFYLPELKSDFLIHRMEQMIRMQRTEECMLYLFYQKANSLGDIYQALELSEERSCMRIGMKPCVSQNITSLSDQLPLLEFYKHFSELIDAYQEADEPVYMQKLNFLYREFKDSDLPLPVVQIAEYCRCILEIDVNSDSFKQFMESFVQHSDEMYQRIPVTSAARIDQIIAYINSSYMNDISINQIASKFNLTPNYISRLFHDKTGTRFIDYVTNIRMMQAKKLLLSNLDTPVKDIALMVGYFSSRHFSTIFKKITGVYPSDYRKQGGTDSETLLNSEDKEPADILTTPGFER